MESVLIISFFLVSIFGVLTHFLHKWIRKGFIVHIFSAINESIWEHMKLSFYPMILITFSQSLVPDFYFPGFWGVSALVILAATVLVPLLYYPIRHLIGREIPAVSISLYFVCILIAFILEYLLIKAKFDLISDQIAFLMLFATFLLFAVFTYYPPRLPLFKDSIFKKYGEFKQPFDKKKK